MSIYIVTHKNKNYLYLLKDEYHNDFLKFWRENRNSEKIQIPDDLKKGIRHSEVGHDNLFDVPMVTARAYQAKVCIHSDPLWWHVNTDEMTYSRIPHD